MIGKLPALYDGARALREVPTPLLTCNLNKPEATFDVVRKSYTDLVPTDAALIATAIVEAGRFASAVYDGKEYAWHPDEYEGMTKAVAAEVHQVQDVVEDPKKKKKEGEEEIVTLTVHVKPNINATNHVLGDRKDLKTLLGDILKEGVEYLYASNDIGWQWTLERVNWATISGGEMRRHIRFHAEFVEPHVGVELGPGGKRRKR